MHFYESDCPSKNQLGSTYIVCLKKPQKKPAISAKHILVTQDQQIFQAFQMRDIRVSPVNILMFTYNNTYLVRLIHK